MPESHTEYWSRRADEHVRLARQTSHQAAHAAHESLARAYRRRAEERRAEG